MGGGGAPAGLQEQQPLKTAAKGQPTRVPISFEVATKSRDGVDRILDCRGLSLELQFVLEDAQLCGAQH